MFLSLTLFPLWNKFLKTRDKIWGLGRGKPVSNTPSKWMDLKQITWGHRRKESRLLRGRGSAA